MPCLVMYFSVASALLILIKLGWPFSEIYGIPIARLIDKVDQLLNIYGLRPLP